MQTRPPRHRQALLCWWEGRLLLPCLQDIYSGRRGQPAAWGHSGKQGMAASFPSNSWLSRALGLWPSIFPIPPAIEAQKSPKFPTLESLLSHTLPTPYLTTDPQGGKWLLVSHPCLHLQTSAGVFHLLSQKDSLQQSPNIQ